LKKVVTEERKEENTRTPTKKSAHRGGKGTSPYEEKHRRVPIPKKIRGGKERGDSGLYFNGPGFENWRGGKYKENLELEIAKVGTLALILHCKRGKRKKGVR